MSGSTIIFYLLAALTLVCGLLAVTSRNILRAAVYLLFSLIGVAGIYFWLEYESAAVQIIVYAGGISVLIIFPSSSHNRRGENYRCSLYADKYFRSWPYSAHLPYHAAGIPI